MSKITILPLSVFLCLVTLFFCTESFSDQNDGFGSFESSFSSPLLVKRDQRKQIFASEFGEISTVQIGDGYQIQFITLEPNAFLLPLLLHSDMVFFVHTGSGILNWVHKEKERALDLRRGDVYRLRSGTVFHVHSDLERDKVSEKLRVYAIFNVEECLYEPCLGAYSSIRDLSLGFNERTLRTAFAVSEEVLGKVRDAAKPPLITNVVPRNRTHGLEDDTWQSRLVSLFVRVEDVTDHLAMEPIIDNKKKKSKVYNVFEADPDFENNNGRSIVVDEKDLHALNGSSVGVFMVNLTKGSMMGPHWNPNACEISIVLRGKGMVRVVDHPSTSSSKSKSERFMVEEGDVFVVPQFHPMAQMSFLNGSFLFMGFSTSAEKNYPQFLVGQSSVLKVFDREVLTASFNLRNDTIEKVLGAQKDSVMLECVSCAEVELTRLMKEIEEKKRHEEEEIERRRKEEEEARKREEEREMEEEAAKKREERRRREKEEEEARKREEEREREEEVAKRQEEERRRREKEEEEARKREEEREREEEAAKRQEEERIRREKEKEAARKREEERKKEEEIAKRREEERQRKEREEGERERCEEQERKKREEEARKREEEREKEEEIARRREEERQRKEREEAERERIEEQERKKREEEARKREEEKEIAKRREEERQRKEREEVERKREEEQEMAKKREEERQRKEREEVERKIREEQERKRREEEAAMKKEEERKREEEAAKRAEEERKRREEEEKRRWPPQPQPQPLTTAGDNVAEDQS